MTATVLQHLKLHKWFTFSVTGKSVAQPAMSELGVPALAGDRGKLE